jgi:hypothetical protein
MARSQSHSSVKLLKQIGRESHERISYRDGSPMPREGEAVGASGSSPVSDFRLPSTGDWRVAPTILLFLKQPFMRLMAHPPTHENLKHYVWGRAESPPVPAKAGTH